MPKVKLNRKGTHIDMTAMCDVVFLLLNFFIMTTKFKPTEPVVINNPSSISQDMLPKTSALITLDKKGRIFFTLNDPEIREEFIQRFEEEKSVTLSATEEKNFLNDGFIGVPMAQLPKYLDLTGAKLVAEQKNMSGIPPIDSNAANITQDEFTYWVLTAQSINPQITIALKVDKDAKYEDLKKILNMFTKNKILRFSFITDVTNIPEGTEAYKQFQQARAKGNSNLPKSE